MSSTSGVINRDYHEILKVYPDDRVKPQWTALPTRVMDLLDPSLISRVSSKIVVNEKLVASTDSNGNQIEYWEIDNVYPFGALIFLTSGGLPSRGDCSTPHTTFADKGYIYTPYDWQNVEGTLFFKVLSYKDPDARITLKTRTGFHPRNQICCQGASYGCNLYLSSGNVELFKESYHHNIHNIDQKPQSRVSSFVNQWVGVKFLVYNQRRGGKTQVKIELRLCPTDMTDDIKINWREVLRKIDFPGSGWGKGAKKCGALFNDSPITWGGPRSMFIFQGIDKVIFKWPSWREIDPSINWGGGGAAPRHIPKVTSVPPGYHFDKVTGQVVINDDEVV